ncbi:MAG: virulence RhuM family protein [Bacteroidota bacterium]|nr:virulence RhuM family protein [Bacteroidota bacterium]
MEQKPEIIIYRTPQGNTKIDVRLINETVWLTQKQLAELFQTTVPNVNMHIKNILEEGELDANRTIQDFLIVQKEGNRGVKRSVEHYNLDMVISVGYRIKSHVATQFRIWATQQLKEFIIKGFVLDDERLKQARNNYFDDLLERIRDIRSSEKMFYRKVCDIYATSVDYDPDYPGTQEFFATVQNKFHYAIHGHTAAEVLLHRADAAKLNMGLTNWPGESIRKEDTEVAKNYLDNRELELLNRIVTQYLEFAELQALSRNSMHMKDWITKLHGFLTLNEKEILMDAGKVSAQLAKEHVHREYEKFKKMIEDSVQDEFEKAIRRIESKK